MERLDKDEQARPRTGEGIDRSTIRQRLAMTPAERARVAVQEARNIEAFRRRLAK